MQKRIRIFQIAYDEATLAALDPHFIPLDNRGNERPDWAEYWPIRKKLLSESFGEEELIGFFSPRFLEKTGMRGEEVLTAIQARDAEVYSFSPYFDLSALYLNPFQQGESVHEGLIAATKELLKELGVDLDPEHMAADQHTTVFCNYLVARPAFWRQWLALGEQLFEICEKGSSELSKKLVSQTRYVRGARPMKVFVMERLMTVLLERTGLRAKLCIDLGKAPRGVLGDPVSLPSLLICDALKAQYRATGNLACLQCFEAVRRSAANNRPKAA